MDFDYVLDEVLRDKRSRDIPILFLLQVLIILDDLNLI